MHWKYCTYHRLTLTPVRTFYQNLIVRTFYQNLTVLTFYQGLRVHVLSRQLEELLEVADKAHPGPVPPGEVPVPQRGLQG